MHQPAPLAANASSEPCLRRHVAPVFPAHILTALVEAMGIYGVESKDLLKGSGLIPAQLTEPATRVSIEQILAVFTNAQSLSQDPLAAARAGARATIASLGIYGYAVLSSPSHAHAVKVIQLYDRMVSPLTAMSFDLHGNWAVWSVTTHESLDAHPAVRRFVLEFKFAAMQSILRDLYGGDQGFVDICLACRPAGADSAVALGTLLGCKVDYCGASNQGRFPAAQMARPMVYANHLTHAQMCQLCDDALQLVGRNDTLAEQVMSQLLRSPGRFPDVNSMALALNLNPRTLQRRLEAEGMHYRELLGRVRARLALRYLRSTAMSTDEVAERLGYSDAANFRHAVLRWFGISPSQIRRGVAPSRQPD